MTTKISADNIQQATLSSLGGGPTVTNIQITNNSYTVLDDTAVSTSGGYIKITGTKFASGCTVVIGTVNATAVAFVNSTTLNVQVPAQSAGTYVVYVINPDSSVAIRVNGLTYSGTPTWVTGSTLPAGISDNAISIQLSATSDTAITYSLQAGSSLPSGLSLTSGGLLSGTVTGLSSETTYNFTIEATDAESQESPRAFSITITVGDTYWTYVTTLLSPTLAALPFNDDASTNNFNITINGDTRPNNFSPYTPGYYSVQFDGTGDYLSVPANAAFNFGSSNLTVECWVYVSSTPSNMPIIGWATGSNKILRLNSSNFNFEANDPSGVSLTVSFPSSLTLNVWNHIALVRSGNSLFAYLNGVSGSATSYTGNWGNSTDDLNIGYKSDPAYFNGYISNLRIVKGTAVYTSTFTPPTEPLTAIANTSLLTCQSNRLIDTSTNNLTITKNGDTSVKSFNPYTPNSSYSSYGSTYFDGTGDYLSGTYNTSFPTGNDAYTIEAWIYLTGTIARSHIVAWGTLASYQSNGFRINDAGNGLLNYWYGDDLDTGNIGIVANNWYHVVAQFDGTTRRIYLNGVSVASANTPAGHNVPTSGTFTVGSSVSAVDLFTGYISNLRIVKGTALYTANFTPSTTPLTAITNTSLLTCQSNQPANNNVFLDNSTNNFAITRNGNTTQGTFSPYGANWSNYFDGSGDYLTVPSNTSFGLGTGDFTVEFWHYTGSRTQLYPAIFSNLATAAWGTNRIAFYDRHNDVPTKYTFWVYNYSTATPVITSTLAPQNNTWYYIALVRSGSSFKLYINGILDTTYTNANTLDGGGSLPWSIGISDTASTTYNGYISNFRLVKGTAVYTSAFTPSTTPLQAVANTVLLTCQSPNLVDNSPNNFAITKNGDVSVQKFGPFAGTTLPTPYYSAYFDGTGDYLTIPGNAAFNLNTGDWTIEYWFYHSADKLTTQISQGEFNWRIQQDGSNIVLVTQAGTRITATSVTLYAWHHLALVSYNGTITLYIDGVSKGTTTSYPGNDSASTVYIGRNPATAAWDFNGYLSNIRIVKGTAVYTGAFTPPTTPLTAISGTSLLTCQSSTFIDNSTNAFTITANGNSKPTTFSPFTVTYSTGQSYTPAVFGGSMYFDGTGDYLSIANSTANQLMASDFTIECWVYMSVAAPYSLGFPLIAKNNGSNGWELRISSSQQFDFVYPSVAANPFGPTLLTSQWYHVAVTKSGSTVSGFVNGIKYSVASSVPAETTVALTLGSDMYQAAFLQGYLSDVRIIKGQALYTSNFVPGNAPVTAVKNTVLLTNGTSGGIYDSSTNAVFETVGDAKLSTSTVKFAGSTSMYFDGNGDYLWTPGSRNFDFGNGDWTIESWVYFNSVSNTPHIFQFGANSGSRAVLYMSAAKLIAWSGSAIITSTTTITTSQWYHVAWVFTASNTTSRLFINGNLEGTNASYNSYPKNAGDIAFMIGHQPYSGGAVDYLNGYISDFRITKGIARYTTNFTAPTTPFANK